MMLKLLPALLLFLEISLGTKSSLVAGATYLTDTHYDITTPSTADENAHSPENLPSREYTTTAADSSNEPSWNASTKDTNTTEPTKDTNTTEPTKDTNTTEPTKDTNTTEPTKDTNTTEPTKDTNTTEPTKDTNTTEPMTFEKATVDNDTSYTNTTTSENAVSTNEMGNLREAGDAWVVDGGGSGSTDTTLPVGGEDMPVGGEGVTESSEIVEESTMG